MVFLAIAFAFILAWVLRAKHIVGFMAVPIGALLVPVEVTLEAFVYPANPEVQMWWRIAVIVGTLYGLIAAGLGYAVAAFAEKHRGA